MTNLTERLPDEYGLSKTELGRKVMLDLQAAFADLKKQERQEERKAVDVRRRIELHHERAVSFLS